MLQPFKHRTTAAHHIGGNIVRGTHLQELIVAVFVTVTKKVTAGPTPSSRRTKIAAFCQLLGIVGVHFMGDIRKEVIPVFRRDTRTCTHGGITCGIDHHFGGEIFPTADCFDEYAAADAVLYVWIGRQRIKTQSNAVVL